MTSIMQSTRELQEPPCSQALMVYMEVRTQGTARKCSIGQINRGVKLEFRDWRELKELEIQGRGVECGKAGSKKGSGQGSWVWWEDAAGEDRNSWKVRWMETSRNATYCVTVSLGSDRHRANGAVR